MKSKGHSGTVHGGISARGVGVKYEAHMRQEVRDVEKTMKSMSVDEIAAGYRNQANSSYDAAIAESQWRAANGSSPGEWSQDSKADEIKGLTGQYINEAGLQGGNTPAPEAQSVSNNSNAQSATGGFKTSATQTDQGSPEQSPLEEMKKNARHN